MPTQEEKYNPILQVERFLKDRRLDTQDFDEFTFVRNVMEEIGELMGFTELPKDDPNFYTGIYEYLTTKFETVSNRKVPSNWDIVDALTDIRVFCIDATVKSNFDPTCSLFEVAAEINSRKQDPKQAEEWKRGEVTGKWQKDVNQDPDTLYKAYFVDCDKD